MNNLIHVRVPQSDPCNSKLSLIKLCQLSRCIISWHYREETKEADGKPGASEIYIEKPTREVPSLQGTYRLSLELSPKPVATNQGDDTNQSSSWAHKRKKLYNFDRVT